MLSTDFSLNERVSESNSRSVGESRVRRRLRWNDEGVASTVGTIMAMMVFLAFLSMFTSQYVPVWMEENEASHMNTVYSQFASLKQAVDMQILAGIIQGTSPVQIFSPVKLGANGIPMFASPTPGYLIIERGASYDNVSFSYNVDVTPTTTVSMNYTTHTGGTVRMYAPNRYYVAQEVAYENDALLIKQPDGVYMKANPQFIVTQSGGRFQISYTQVDLRCDDSNYIGYGTRGIQTLLRSAKSVTYTNLTSEASPGVPATYEWLYITHTTWYESAWNATFNQTLSAAHMTYGTDYMIVSTQLPEDDPLEEFWEVTVMIDPNVISKFTLTEAYIDVVTSEMGAA